MDVQEQSQICLMPLCNLISFSILVNSSFIHEYFKNFLFHTFHIYKIKQLLVKKLKLVEQEINILCPIRLKTQSNIPDIAELMSLQTVFNTNLVGQEVKL